MRPGGLARHILEHPQITAKDTDNSSPESRRGFATIPTLTTTVRSLYKASTTLEAYIRHKLKLAPSPTCLCSREDQTINQILQRCHLLQTCQGIWQTTNQLKTCCMAAGRIWEKKIHYQKMDLTFVQTNAKKK